jgi:hypothetical protein
MLLLAGGVKWTKILQIIDNFLFRARGDFNFKALYKNAYNESLWELEFP